LFESRIVGDHLVVLLKIAKIDSLNADEFQSEIDEVISKSTQNVILDCTKLAHIDSSGLGKLLAAFKDLQTDKRSLRLINVNSKIHNIIRITELENIFPQFDSIEEAMSD